MGKKVIFLPFINSDKEDQDWRKTCQDNFLGREDIKNLTADIEKKRSDAPKEDDYKNVENGKQKYEEAVRAYLNELHSVKSERQESWLRHLVDETAKLFEDKLKELKNELTEGEFKGSVIVAALPEFFWCDINDNHKHEDKTSPVKNGKYIIGYHKPLYHHNLKSVLFSENNPFKKLTKDNSNLIIFAGTTMWKAINPNNHLDEKIYNTLYIYHSGEIVSEWSKCFVSTIDGFYADSAGIDLVKDKIGSAENRDDLVPFIDFNGVKFTYDICLDFISGSNGQPLSTERCKSLKTDVNVLISAGMPIYDKDLTKINSPVILRCDGSYPPYAEIAPKGAYLQDADKSILDSEKPIGKLETEINIPQP